MLPALRVFSQGAAAAVCRTRPPPGAVLRFGDAAQGKSWPGALTLRIGSGAGAGGGSPSGGSNGGGALVEADADFEHRPWVMTGASPAQVCSHLRHALLGEVLRRGDQALLPAAVSSLVFLEELQARLKALHEGGVGHTARYDELFTRPWELCSGAGGLGLPLLRFKTALHPRDRLLYAGMAPMASLVAGRLGGSPEQAAVWRLAKRGAIGLFSEEPWRVEVSQRYPLAPAVAGAGLRELLEAGRHREALVVGPQEAIQWVE